jgi:hypothetical protein
LDFSQWYLPLSGGVDSRGILCLLTGIPGGAANLKTITWGTEDSYQDTERDAYVAKELADYYKVSNTYYHTDLADGDVEQIFNRFIKLGEGRIDHIAGYMDGFHIWKTLYNNGVQGIIRGDEGFGWNKVSSELYVRLGTGLTLCEDFLNLRDYENYGFARQVIPKNLQRRRAESLPRWRDRIYHEYRLPTIIAALTDLKLAYVEQITPLLAKNILYEVRELPDHLRTNKKLFREIVEDFNLNIRYATKSSIAKPGDILKTNETINHFKSVLSSEDAVKLFPLEFIELVLSQLTISTTEKATKNLTDGKKNVKGLMPDILKNVFRKYIIRPKIDYHLLAFRIYIVCKMHKLLLNDR